MACTRFHQSMPRNLRLTPELLETIRRSRGYVEVARQRGLTYDEVRNFAKRNGIRKRKPPNRKPNALAQKWTPELKAKYGPARGWLTDAEVATLVQSLKTSKQCYVDIAVDWLIHPRRVSAIALAHGVRRNRTKLSLTALQQQALLATIRRREQTYAEIAQQFRVTARQVAGFARKHGVRRGQYKKHKLSKRDRDRVVALCKNSLLSFREIGCQFGIATQTVSSYALAAGVRRGRNGETISRYRIAELKTGRKPSAL